MRKLIAAIIALTLGAPAFAGEPRARRVDINTATEEQLKAMPGVGDEGAKRIVAGRPYAEKAELKTRNVVSADVYEKIQKLIESVC